MLSGAVRVTGMLTSAVWLWVRLEVERRQKEPA